MYAGLGGFEWLAQREQAWIAGQGLRRRFDETRRAVERVWACGGVFVPAYQTAASVLLSRMGFLIVDPIAERMDIDLYLSTLSPHVPWPFLGSHDAGEAVQRHPLLATLVDCLGRDAARASLTWRGDARAWIVGLRRSGARRLAPMMPAGWAALCDGFPPPADWDDLVLQHATSHPQALAAGVYAAARRHGHGPSERRAQAMGRHPVLARTSGIPVFEDDVLSLVRAEHVPLTPSTLGVFRRCVRACERHRLVFAWRLSDRTASMLAACGRWLFTRARAVTTATLELAAARLWHEAPTCFERAARQHGCGLPRAPCRIPPQMRPVRVPRPLQRHGVRVRWRTR